MSAGRYTAALAAGALVAVACVLGVTVVIVRRGARKHAAYRATRGGAR